MAEKLRLGIYRHYKGPLYQVLGLAHDANYEGRVAVVYIGLQLDAAHLGPRLAVRNLDRQDSWTDFLHPDTWGKCNATPRCEDAVPRFEYLGQVLETWMLDPSRSGGVDLSSREGWLDAIRWLEEYKGPEGKQIAAEMRTRL